MGNLSSYNLRPRDKNNRSSYLLLSSSFPSLSLNSFVSLVDTGATSNYISLDLAQSLNVETVQCSYITLANGTNIKSFITKEKVLVKVGTFSFYSRFKVVKGLTYRVILGMDWWRLCEPTVDLGKGQVVVRREGKVHHLPLESHNIVLDKIPAINTLSHDSPSHKEIEPTQPTTDWF